MRAVFVMIKVEPGMLSQVADHITELESFSEAYSISGAYDLLVKLYVEDFDALSHLVNEQVQKIPHIHWHSSRSCVICSAFYCVH